MRHLLAGLLGVIAVVGVVVDDPQSVAAANLPPGFTDTVVAGGLGRPTAVAALPDGRMLVTSQEGKLWVVAANGGASVAVDLAALSKVCTASEMGLLGVTVDPRFSSNSWVYVFYTARIGSCTLNGANPGGAKNRVSRFTMSGSTINPATEVPLLDNMPEWGGNHNGGDVRVASDGTLFVSVGDGGGGSPASNPSDLSLPNGKILRIALDGSIPPGNPHGATSCRTAWGPPGAAKVCGEVWADGLRNPFRLGFDVSASGVKFRINDVGDQTWEEVNDAVAGAHYGWPCREGPSPHPSSVPCRTPMTDPVLFYNQSTGCNVQTGGAFVPPGVWPGFDGAYIWVDFGCGQLFLAPPGATGLPPVTLATGMQLTTDLEFLPVGGAYSLFYTTFAGGGQLHRVVVSPGVRWESLGGVLDGGPAAAAWAPGRLDVFATGTDRQLWHCWYAGVWAGWEPLGGRLDGAPAVAAWAPGRLDVFATGTDGQLWHRWYDGGWSQWEALGGRLSGSPAVAAWSAGRLDVFVTGTDGQLWHRWYDGGWSQWEALGGGLSSGPAVAAWAPGRLDVFARGTDRQLWHRWYDGGWSQWEALGGLLDAAPAVASWSAGRLDVFVTGTDRQLWHRWYTGGWSHWEALGGPLDGGPAVAAWAPGRLDVFAKGIAAQLLHTWYDGAWF